MPSTNPEYVAYFPGGEVGSVDLPDLTKPLTAEWFNMHTGERRITDPVVGGMRTDFAQPWLNEAVLYLHRTVDAQMMGTIRVDGMNERLVCNDSPAVYR